MTELIEVTLTVNGAPRRAVVEARKTLADALQKQAFADVPYLPLGQYFNQTSYKPSVTGVLDGVPVFWNVKKG